MYKKSLITLILDANLNKNALEHVYSKPESKNESKLSKEALLASHQAVFKDLVRYITSIIRHKINDSLSDEEHAHIRSRVENFLVEHGIQINRYN